MLSTSIKTCDLVLTYENKRFVFIRGLKDWISYGFITFPEHFDSFLVC
ncbi:MAG: hypothetical protein JETT_3580 [Candidatus Jettenia ecosi]|uniref:Uncharacterized protein n=1 Tax=Candidatus Jettenia ecosi TaxID=2494326 RepID=A0A533Q6I8_9BACT|nr:MAG: hypothetical protein JETT_3580 [Candidatus Jettenia ecosi]